MNLYKIIVGSMLGGTEYVAETCEEVLKKLGYLTEIHLIPDFKTITNNIIYATNDTEKNINNEINTVWLICTSTYGAGDYPDNIQKFVSDLDHCAQDLSTVSFLTIGIGDSNYDTYCLAAKKISSTLKSRGCIEIIPIKTIDMSLDIDPEAEASQWLLANKDHLTIER